MILDNFLNVVSDIRFLTRDCPCHPCLTQEQNLQRIDEVRNSLRGIDISMLCAEILDVKSKDEAVFRIKLIEEKIADKEPFIELPNDWNIVLSKSFNEDTEKEINAIMREQTKNYLLKWNWVFDLWGFMSNEIICTIDKLARLGELEPQQQTQEQAPKETPKEYVERRFNDVKELAIHWKLIEDKGGVLVWKSTQNMYAYFWSALLLGDKIIDRENEYGYSETIWKDGNKDKSLDIFEDTIRNLIPLNSNKTTQELKVSTINNKRFKKRWIIDKVVFGVD